ncbi:MAG: DNA methyltransferase [Pseudanabaenaceae cyanobacterium bins.68]|nr:DNA methyltransferase [Pseudanabaenaceae cyanobacterium bins.68]
MAPRNRTLSLTTEEYAFYQTQLMRLDAPTPIAQMRDRLIHQDLFEVLAFLPPNSVDLLFLDPPYNLTKNFNGQQFKQQSPADYCNWLEVCLQGLLPTLKTTASVYVCADWQTSIAIAPLMGKYFQIRNRITWERHKGRGSQSNWKNNAEDIWFCTVGARYTFNAQAVKLKRRVLAPYTANGQPKDWQATPGGNYRLTAASNLWTDLTVPFWSMAENTDHPTQKPEKLVAKMILASSNPGDLVLDPFLGSGTGAVVAKKLGRNYVGIEQDLMYACLAAKRLARAAADQTIQGYQDGVFWERNSRMKD